MRLLVVVAAFALSACSVATPLATGSFHRSYFPRQLFADEQRVDGRALVITAPADDAVVYSGPPTRFGGDVAPPDAERAELPPGWHDTHWKGFNLTLPLGVIAREATAIAFGDLFRDGADRTNLVTGLERYRVVVAPRVTQLQYRFVLVDTTSVWRTFSGDFYDVVPLVAVTLTVDLVDSHGKSTWERSYTEKPQLWMDPMGGSRASGLVHYAQPGGATQEPERWSGDGYGNWVSRVAHLAIYNAARRAAEDVAAEIRARSRRPRLAAPVASVEATAPAPRYSARSTRSSAAGE